MTKSRLLLLDDDREFASAVRRGLGNRFIMTHAATTSDARSAFCSGCDVALIDIVLDEQESTHDRRGFDFLRWAADHFPDVPLIVLTGHGADDLEVEALRNGAADYIEKGRLNLKLLEAKIAALLERCELRSRARDLEMRLEQYEPCVLVGKSVVIETLRQKVAQYANSDATVLVSGESGAGKEVVVRSLHASSQRRGKALVAVNCAALSASLLESELFGHERGAFTGAERLRPGRFEKADGGTLLLDEITELDPGLQAKLLRALQEKQIFRVGSSDPLDVDVRVVATTNRDPGTAVREGVLRKDLYYRLDVLRIHVPPLREHREDIPILVDHFLQMLERRVPRPSRRFAPSSLDILCRYSWPGNIRELQNVVERVFTLCKEESIPPESVVPCLGLDRHDLSPPVRASDGDLNIDRRAALAQLEAIAMALEKTDGVKEKTQELLGFRDRSTMRRTVYRLRREFPTLWFQFPVLERYYPASTMQG